MKEESRKTGMQRLIELAFMKKHFIIPAVILSALASIASFIPYIAIYMIVNELLNNINDLTLLNSSLIISYGLYAFLGVALNILLYFLALGCSHLAAFGTLYDLKVNFASHLAKVPLGFHMNIGSGKLRKIMDENIEKIEGFIAHQLPDIVASFVAPIVMIIIIFGIDWRFGIAVFVGIAFSFFLQMKMYGNSGASGMMAKYQKSLEEMNNATVEYIRGISVVKAFKQTVYSFKSLNKTIDDYTNMVIPYTLSWENSFSLFNAIINNLYLFIVIMALIIGPSTENYPAFVSTFIFYLIFVPSISSILMKVMYVNSSSMQIINGVDAMDKILDYPEITNPQTSKEVNSYDIVFDNVFFSYNNETNAINDLSFTAKQGNITAIVGPSGGGKSTIAHLIPRFFDINEGSITIGDVSIKDINREDLMDIVSFVFQDTYLFKQSIKDNIKMGNSKASDEEVINAAKSAQCHDFIMGLPNGYDTVIGGDGIHLSGGEQQRVSIARAIIKDAPIIVLDEATAFADPENERLIKKAFEKLIKNKTVIIIAHRLSTIVNANKIVVVDEGRVLEEGSHEELLEKGQKYSEMWQTYLKSANWKIDNKEGELSYE